MAHFELRISGDTNDDAHIFGLFAGAGAGPAPVESTDSPPAEKPARPPRKNAKAEEAETAPTNKPVDPAVAAAQGGDAYEGKTQPNTGQKLTEKDVVMEKEVLLAAAATDEVGETTEVIAAAPSDVTLEQLKAVMTRALDKNSAKVCQDAVRASASGAASLSSADAEHYPAIYAALLPLAGE